MSYRINANAIYSSQQQTQDLNTSSSSLPPRINLSSSRRSSLSSMDVTERKGLTPQRSYPSLSSSLRSSKKKSSSRRRSIGSDLSLPTSVAANKKIASDKRNREFHALFKSIPLDDNLIEDYGCALQKEILLQGRIYITQHHLCFNANIFGWITNLVIALTDIVEIEKRTTAIFIPNAISISTHQSKHFFASFLSREQAHEQMVAVWRQAQQQMSSITVGSSMQGSTDDSSSQCDDTDDDDLSLTPWEDYEPGSNNIMKRTNGVSDITTLALPNQSIGNNDRQPSLASLPIPSNANEMDAARRRAVSEAGPQPNTKTFIQHSAEVPLPSSIITKTETSPSGGDVSPAAPSTAIPTQQQTQCQCADNSDDHYPHTVLDQTYNCSLESLYNLLYHSGFIKKYLTHVEKSSDIVISPWRKGDDIPYVRDISYIKYFGGAIGLKSTKCILKEELIHVDLNKSITHETTTQTPDVPSGSSFRVKTRVCISWAGLGQVRMLVTVFIAFSKSSWLKSTIEKASIDGQINYFKELNTAIRKYTESHLDVPPRSKKTRHGKRKDSDSANKCANGTITSNTPTNIITTKDHLSFSANGVFGMLVQMTGGFLQISDKKVWISLTMAQCTMMCLVLMVVTNLYIAYKMINMGQQLYALHLDGPHHTWSPSNSPLDMWRQEHQQEVMSMWQYLDQLEKDPLVASQYYGQHQQYQWRQHYNQEQYSTTNNNAKAHDERYPYHQQQQQQQQQQHWYAHSSSLSHPRSKQMNNHITELEKMIHYTERSVDQVNRMVKQHRDSLLQH